MEKFRNTYAEIRLDYLKDNLDYIYETCKKPMMAIVKANAYGHGSLVVSQECETNPHIIMYGVATLGEALELRSNAILKDILVLGATRIEDALVASQYDVSISAFSLDFVKELVQATFIKPLKVHMKLDTGMNRIGLKSKEELDEALELIKTNHKIIVDGIFTHYGAADELNNTYDKQFNRYKEMVGDRQFKYMHASNTAGALYHHEDFTNMVRAGIAIYGIEPNGSDDTELKQVMSLKTKVVMVKQIKKGEQVGYGFTYKAKRDEYIATVPIGYADGIIRKNQNRDVFINNAYYKIVGRICMDQMMIRVDENVKVGDTVEIFGDHISLNQMAKELSTIPYEIICLISPRVKRVYFYEGHYLDD